jgi:light-regulated signal transduction histidine kinase (bacteriophytochrome)
MKQLYGLSQEPSITYEDFWKAVHRDDVTPLNDALEQALAGTKEFDTEFRVIWPNQSVHYLRSFAYVRRDEQGKAIQLIGVCWDITDSREDRIQLERSKKELEAFSYSVSHDLRGPLRGIQGWSQALQEDYGNRLDAQAHEFLGRVQSEARRMAELIDDLLRLSRIMQSELVTSTIDLSELAVLIAKREQALHPERKLEFIIEEGLQAFGDRKLLEILITNLFTNAVKFTGQKPHARIEFGTTKGPTITKNAFFVRDNGVGFDSSKSKNLFGAFQRLHRQSEFPGNGIGLATVSRIVGLHRGEVWAESSVGHGAVFYFTLNS